MLRAVQPRLPCYKLGIRFGDEQMVKRFMQAGRYGVYFAVVQPGSIGAGDSIEHIYRDPHDVAVTDIARLFLHDKHNIALMRRAADHEALPVGWREYFREQLAKAGR